MRNGRLEPSFFRRHASEVAPGLLGKVLVRVFDDGSMQRYVITETEAYCGTSDLACHASKGRTPRTDVMFREGGLVYVYFVYGMYWMLNIVTGYEGDPSAVLIRGAGDVIGPGRIGRLLKMDRSFYGEELAASKRIWIEDSGVEPKWTAHPRVGIHYAGEPWISMPWRFSLRD